MAPGAHVPWHMPLTHAWLVHESAGPQAPLSLHVCTPLPWSEHRVDWGAHSPVQAPSTHAWLPQSIGAPQWPVASQIWTPLNRALHRLRRAARRRPVARSIGRRVGRDRAICERVRGRVGCVVRRRVRRPVAPAVRLRGVLEAARAIRRCIEQALAGRTARARRAAGGDTAEQEGCKDPVLSQESAHTTRASLHPRVWCRVGAER